MKILIIVDLQVGFNTNPSTRRCVDRCLTLASSHDFEYIFATQFINAPSSPYVRFMHWNKMQASSPTTALIPNLHYDALITKSTYSCVTPTFIRKLKHLNHGTLPKKIYLCGIDTDGCVLKTAVDLFEHDIRPIVLKNYCASSAGPTYHRLGLKLLSRLIGKDNIL